MGLFSKKHSIGKTIAELRKEKGWTQIELAEKLQVSDKAISKWEKDNGAPSVEFFPLLADLFGVSIDYIMTGKEPEKEVVTMSKIELCAQNDDIKLFNSLSEEVITSKDENGKTLLNYAFEYRCPKIVGSLLAKYSAKNLHDWTCSGEYTVKFWYPEQILELLIRYSRIKELEELGVFSTIFYGDIRRTKEGNNAPNIYTAQYRKIILTDSNISDELKLRYFQSGTAQAIVECLNDLLDLNDRKQIEVLWKFIKETNEKNIAAYEKRKKEIRYDYENVCYTNKPRKKFEAIGRSDYDYFFVVPIPVPLLEKLLDKGFIDIARQTNTYNAKIGGQVLNEERFAYAEGKLSGKLSKKELTVLQFTKNGIIDIELLLQVKDFKTVKEILLNNPIHTVELLYNWLKARKTKELFRFAVDNNLNSLANYVKNEQNEKIKAELVEMFKKHLTYEGYPVVNGKVIKVSDKRLNQYNLTIEEIIEYLAAYKQQILTELSYELDKQKTIGDLTKDYFEKELAKGNYEIVIIKLCVRLEAILRCDYHYEGDFSDMLTRFCGRFETYDDESNDYDPHTPRILNKLRIHRNSIVHSEKATEQLSIDELKFCIDYICKLG